MAFLTETEQVMKVERPQQETVRGREAGLQLHLHPGEAVATGEVVAPAAIVTAEPEVLLTVLLRGRTFNLVQEVAAATNGQDHWGEMEERLLH